MSSNASKADRRGSDDARSSSSILSSRPSQEQQRLESALSELESSFERDSHSSRYASHVLDIHASNSSSSHHKDDVSSIGSTDTAQWFAHQDEPRGEADDSHSGISDLWQRQQSTGLIDQSVNLMDAQAATYEEPLSSLDTAKRSGLESFRKPEAEVKGHRFAFPTFSFLRSEEKESTIRTSKIGQSKKWSLSNVKQGNANQRRNRHKWALIVVGILVAMIATAVILVSTHHGGKKSSQFEGEGYVTAVKTAAKNEANLVESYEAKDGGAQPKDTSFETFEAAANSASAGNTGR